MKAIILGIISSFFFASTFVLNRAMELGGGNWIWSSVLRYLFMLPLLLIIVLFRGNLGQLIQEFISRPVTWILWSTIGFGIFYAPICFAAAYGPSWLVASTWQITIIAGSLLAPLFKEKIEIDGHIYHRRGSIPIKGTLISLLILLGVIIVQMQQAQNVSIHEIILGVLPVFIAAFAYPLGNRKMMEICGEKIDTFQRVLGMTIGSMPFWLILSVYGFLHTGVPSKEQIIQSSLVAIFSGVIATLLFFKATDLTRGNLRQLAAVEATQSGEVIFALIGELLILHGQEPTISAIIGILLVIIGMILHSYFSHSSDEKGLVMNNSSKNISKINLDN